MQLQRSMRLAALWLAGWGTALSAQAQWNWATLSGPDWEIAFTDAGYSDYLLDRTPGFEGREYLSGEWGAAVGYQRNGRTVTPNWLEPMFSFPDWRTNSGFSVIQPMTLGSLNAQGLPTARSVLSDGALQVSQTVQLLDTRTGIAMGAIAASSGGAGASRLSNRYVLQQTYTFTNVSNDTLGQLQLFQLLHGLTSQNGVYDNRAYGGAMADYRYDVTLAGDAQSSGGQFDYITFHSRVAPSAIEIGRYGVEGIDDHVTGKPSVGTHLSIENNALNGVDQFAPAERWVAGAQRWELGTLAPGQSVSFDLALSILTGWQVHAEDNSGSLLGGSGHSGGVDYRFLGTHGAGQFFAEYEAEDAAGIAELISAGEIGPLTFASTGGRLQLFSLEYEGSFAGGLELRFGFDAGLSSAADALRLHVYHWVNGEWVDLGGAVDVAGHTITVETDSLSPFALGLAPVPEPAAWMLMLAGVALLLLSRRRRTS